MDVTELDMMDSCLFRSGRASAVFRALRRDEPVYWQPPRGDDKPGFWVVSRYRDVVDVLRRPEIFSSAYGNILPNWEFPESATGLMAVITDPPEHTRLRAMLMPSLSHRAVARRRPVIERIAAGVLADIPRGEPFDFMETVANRLPVAVTCGLLGVPAAEIAMVRELIQFAHGIKENDEREGPTAQDDEFCTAHLELLAYFSDLAAMRRATPADDLMSAMVHAEADGHGLSDEEAALNSFGAVLGGYQADKSAQGGAILALVQHPEQLDMLMSGRIAVPSAVEEIWRWTSPTLNLTRVALTDTEIAGVPVAAQDRVCVSLFSANRDEEAFPGPEDFLLARESNRHVAFGHGCHLCAGANVARMEMTLLLEWIINSGVRPVLTGEPEPLFSYFEQGLKQLPVMFTRAEPDGPAVGT